ncbi:MAG: insulinase family protein, partial [Bacteroidales bacterium]|nr:insulinase family protein [Bacteroidales bacterium]
MKNITRSLKWSGATVSLFVCVLLSVLILSGCKKHDMHGFKLIEKRFVKELNAECYLFEHTKSGAHLLKIVSDDPNKTFGIAFKTFPESDAGTPHIMEHSVLNGSKNFPVKSPFDVLSKGSLNTFINAFTGKDMTMYPVASMNDKDYFNLMHIYLDAVFNPLIYDDPRILKQEGWHYELTAENEPVVYKGVVYNEMKGSFSSPTRVLNYEIYKNLFPDNPYGLESGGYPAAIPTLTREDFLNYHKRYYHPDNSYIVIYGNADMEKELAFIDSAYLCNYDKGNNPVTVTDQAPFSAMKNITAYYPVLKGANTEGQTYLSYSFVAGHNTDQKLTWGLDILCEVLVNQESAPVRLALQEAGIGQDVSASLDAYNQNVVQIVVTNANPGDSEKFMEVVRKTLQKVSDSGVDKEEIEGVLNRMEFQLREGDNAQKGLTYGFQSLSGWFFADNPFLTLEWEKPLAALKKGINEKYLESLITDYFLNNPHSLELTLEPKPGLEDENMANDVEVLKEYKAGLTEDQIKELVKETEELVAYQEREDTPEALASIPLLDISDINPKAEWFGVEEMEVAGVPVIHCDQFTNNVVYMNLMFDLRVLPYDLVPYASLLSNVLSLLNTENYSYGDLNKSLNINTGMFNVSLPTYLENQDDDLLIPEFEVTSKAMGDKVGKMFELTGEILNKTLFCDTERLKTVIDKHQAQLDANVKRNGYGYASRRQASYVSKRGMFREETEGLDYYWFVTDLAKKYDSNPQVVCETLTKVANLLFNKQNLLVATTCDKNQLPVFSDGLKELVAMLPDQPVTFAEWNLEPVKKNEGLLTPSKVQYVVEGADFKDLGYQWDGKLRVLNQVLSTDYLQTKIRVMGGAYGGWSVISPNGMTTFNSYRDPNLKETLINYDGVPAYLTAFETDDKGMTRYIIGTIAGMDTPLTPSQKGDRAVSYYLSKTSQEELQQDR